MAVVCDLRLVREELFKHLLLDGPNILGPLLLLATRLGRPHGVVGFIPKDSLEWVFGRCLECWLLKAKFADQLLLQFTQRLDRAVGELDCLDHVLIGQLVRKSFDHRDFVIVAGNDQVEIALQHLGVRGEEHELAVDATDSHTRDWPAKRRRANHQCRTRSCAAKRRGIVLAIRSQHVGLNLNLVLIALREEGAQRPISDAGGQNLTGRRAAFTLEEAAGKSSCCSEPLAIIDLQWEEVDSRTRRTELSRHKQHRFAVLQKHSSAGLLCDFTGREPHDAAGDFPFDRDFFSED